MADSWADLPLSDDHKTMLQNSRISAEVAAGRGYRTVHEPTELTALGFERRQAPAKRMPGLLVPMYRPGLTGSDPEPTGYQMRPAIPRKVKGRDIKYETPAGLPNRLDIHPMVGGAAGDPTRRLFVVEGVKKADALVSQGEVALAIAGVWSWRGTNPRGGKTALAGFEDVALNDREVLVTFDSDAQTNPHVLMAMVRLVHFLRSRGARASYLVVPADGVHKCGADDFIAQGHTVAELVELATAEDPKHLEGTYVSIVADEVDDRHIYIPDWDKWMTWDGRRWALDPQGLHLEEAILDALKALDPGIGFNPGRLLRLGQTVRKLLERDVQRFHVASAMLDAHPRLLNVANGIVDLDSGELTTHRPELRMTKITAGAYRPGVMNPDAEAVTRNLVPPDAVEWLQRFIGYAIRGEITEEILVVFDGRGSNGKTTLLEACGAALGDYCDAIPPRLLMGAGSEHPTLEADLFGMRLVYAVETGEDGVLAIDRVKAYTGGDRRKGRRMREDYWAFDPTHTLVLATNHRPEVPSSDYGSWRRMRLVPFPYRFVPHPELPNDRHGDSQLRQRLRTVPACWDAMVTWAVDGSIRYASQGLSDSPASIAEATKAWRDESDPIAVFIRERAVIAPDESIDQAVFASQFNEWRGQAGYRGPAWQTQKIKTELANAADANGWVIEDARSNGKRLLRGIRLTRPGEDPHERRPTSAPTMPTEPRDWYQPAADFESDDRPMSTDGSDGSDTTEP